MKIISKIICLVLGHIYNPGEYIDSHDNWDALSYCERCDAWDIAPTARAKKNAEAAKLKAAAKEKAYWDNFPVPPVPQGETQ